MCFFKPAGTPGNPQNRPEMGAPGPPDIVGLSQEIFGFRNPGGGPVGHPQSVRVKTLILTIKCLPKSRHVKATGKVARIRVQGGSVNKNTATETQTLK